LFSNISAGLMLVIKAYKTAEPAVGLKRFQGTP